MASPLRRNRSWRSGIGWSLADKQQETGKVPMSVGVYLQNRSSQHDAGYLLVLTEVVPGSQQCGQQQPDMLPEEFRKWFLGLGERRGIQVELKKQRLRVVMQSTGWLNALLCSAR